MVFQEENSNRIQNESGAENNISRKVRNATSDIPKNLPFFSTVLIFETKYQVPKVVRGEVISAHSL